MARVVNHKNNDQPEPDRTDLELNLAFASTTEIVKELLRRCNCAVVSFQLTDAMMESEPSEDNANKDGGGIWTATDYTGNIAQCVGLCEVMKHDLLKEW